MTDSVSGRKRWWEQHVVLLATLLLFAVLTVRLWVVSRGNLTTVSLLVRYSSPAEVAVSLAVFLVPFVWAGAMAVATGLAVRWGRFSVWWHWALFVATVLLLSCVFVSFLGLVMAVGLTGGVAILTPSDDEPENGDRWGYRADRLLWVLAIATLVLLASSAFIFSSPPWFPPVAVTLEGQEPETYYLVANSDGEQVLLAESDRRVVIVADDEVKDSTPCQQPVDPFVGPPILFSYVAAADYPECPGSTG